VPAFARAANRFGQHGARVKMRQALRVAKPRSPGPRMHVDHAVAGLLLSGELAALVRSGDGAASALIALVRQQFDLGQGGARMISCTRALVRSWVEPGSPVCGS
jgi:hypothetical protein